MALLSRLIPLVFLLNVAVVFAGNTTCIDQDITWYNNENGESPCKVYERLMQVCVTDFEMYNTAYPPSYNPCNNVGCCCNTIAYSLWSACWSCQWGTPYPSNNPATYSTFLGEGLGNTTGVLCPNGLNLGILPPQYATGLQSDPPPEWSYIIVGINGVWNYSQAELNATVELAISSSIAILSMLSTQSVASTASVASASAASVLAALHKKSNVGAIAGGVVGGIAVLALIAAAAIFFLCKRRKADMVKQEPTAFIAPEPEMQSTPFVLSGRPTPAASSGTASSYDISSKSQSSRAGLWPGGDPQAPSSYWATAGPSFPIVNSSFPPAGSKAEEAAREREGYRMSTVTQTTSSGQVGSSGHAPAASVAASHSSSAPPVPRITREEDGGVSLGDASASGSHVVLPPLYQPAWNDRREV